MSIFLIILFLLHIILKERIFLPLPGLGREVPFFEIPFLLSACGCGLANLGLVFRCFSNQIFNVWMPYLVLGIILPVAGVVLLDYPLTTLYGIITVVANPLAAIIVARVVYKERSARIIKAFSICVNAGVIIQAVFAMLQLLRILGFSNFLVDIVTVWDIESQARIKEEYVIIGRSVGTFINPNVLGVWCLGAFFWNLLQSRGAVRILFCGLTTVTLVLSQSRGSAIGLVAGVCVYVVWLFRTQNADKTSASLGVVIGTVTAAILLSLSLAIFSPSFSFLPGSERWKGGVEVITRGVGADANFATRVQVWRESIDFLNEHPLGTWGPPQVKFVLPPDNLYVHTLLQGSVFYLGSLLLGFVLTSVLIFSRDPLGALLGVVSVALSANAVSALPLLYAPGLLFWFFLGLFISAKAYPEAMASFEFKNLLSRPHIEIP